jgi:hypothetical protein
MRHSPSAEAGAASAAQRTAAGGRSGIGRLIPRLPILGDLRRARSPQVQQRLQALLFENG